MKQEEIIKRLTDKLGARIVDTYTFQGQSAVCIKPVDLVAVCETLRDDPELDFNILMDIGGVDYLDYGDDRDWRFEVAYQFYSVSKNHRFRVKVRVTDEKVELPSLWKHWGVANWMEREVYDMFGLRFTGHPNLRRILCHDDFVGHALRKDYPKQRRQKLSRPTELILTDDPEWA